MPHEPLLTMADVAQILNVSVARAYELGRTNVIPVVRVGRQVRVKEADLRAWIDAGGAALPGGWRREA